MVSVGSADLPVFLSDHPPKNDSILLNRKLRASVTANNTDDGQKAWNSLSGWDLFVFFKFPQWEHHKICVYSSLGCAITRCLQSQWLGVVTVQSSQLKGKLGDMKNIEKKKKVWKTVQEVFNSEQKKQS